MPFDFSREEKIVIISFACLIILGSFVRVVKVLMPSDASISYKTTLTEKIAPKRVNINTALADELVRLDGIGPRLAGDIMAFRKQNGLFRVKEDIMKVKGIGPKTYESIKDRIDVKG